MLKLYISGGIFVATIGIILFFLRPEWERYSMIQGETTALDAVSSEFDTLKIQRDKLVEKINAISKEDTDRLLQAVPKGPKGPEFLLYINDLAKAHKLDLQRLSLINRLSTKSKSKTPGPAEAPLLDASGQAIVISEIKADANLRGGYEDFKKFLADMEHYIRITDAVEVDLTPSVDKKDFFEYKLGIKTYYQ